MISTQGDVVLRHIRGIAVGDNAGRLGDGQLLERFATTRDEAAFAALVRRHGPLVLGVCRRVLGNAHDAEDAFQATFLILARKASSVGRQASLSSWLYQVAYHTALRSRKLTARRRERETKAPSRRPSDALAEVTGRELMTVLDEELNRLPERLRAPLVLCYLQGKARDEAARELGWTLGTLKRRLEEGRASLHARMARRGVTLAALAAGLGAVAVSSALAAATVAAARLIVSGREAALSAGVALLLHESAGRRKVLGAVLLAATLAAASVGLLAHRAPAASADTPPAAAETPPPKPEPRPVAAPASTSEQMIVTGRVLGPDGKPVAGAQLAVVGSQVLYFSSFETAAMSRNSALGRTRADADGKFRLSVPRLPPGGWRKMRLFAAADGLGLAWKWFDLNAESADLEIRLPAEQVIRGRIVDLQGEPVAGARVPIAELVHKPAKGEKNEGGIGVPPEGLPVGPANATTNARGEFTIRGLGTNVSVEMEVHDDRVELHTFTVDMADKKQAENVKLALPPGRIVEGRVTYEDTGKPAGGRRVMVITAGGGDVTGSTDKDGRYHLNARPPGSQFPESGNELGVHVYPPAGTPYWMAIQGVNWVKGATRHETNVKLPRGVLVRGKVTEAGTGKPVAGAYIEYNGQWQYRGVSGPDGSYAFGVPAGATGPLTVNGPTPDYVPQAIGSAAILGDLKGGDRIYYHAVVPLDLKPGDKEKELPVVLRRGVTLKGRVLGPDGKPVKHALVFASEYRPPSEKYMGPVMGRDGQFEMPGCDPDRTYRLVIVEHPWLTPVMGVEALNTFGQLWLSQLLGAHLKQGATVEVSAKKAAAEPVEVRLAPCGSVKLRFVDGAGKPLAKYKPGLQLVVTPGLPVGQAIKEGKLAAEVVTLISQYVDDKEPHAGEDGVLKLEGLIPGATYRVRKAEYDTPALEDFTAEAGKTVEVTVTVK